jgi:hypothetical protein
MSYSGTVHCGHCYKEGHNKTNCPKMREQARANPDGYQAKQIAEIEARKAKPKVCSYCDTSGHTRAGCEIVKRHKITFTSDAILWRNAMIKWMKETGMGVGALVRVNDASYHRGDKYMYPTDDDYIPPVGLIMNAAASTLSHYTGIMNSPTWTASEGAFSFECIGAEPSEPAYRRTIGITLPDIPGIIPRFGKGYYGNEQLDRRTRINNCDWEVVSPGQTDFSSDKLMCRKELKKTVKHHFAGPQQQVGRHFHTFDSFQRTQLRDYVNGEIELSEMKDPEVPEIHT